MDFSEVLQVLTTIAEEPSTTIKKKIIDENIGDDFFRTVLLLALDSRFHYKIKELPNPAGGLLNQAKPMTKEEVLIMLRQLSEQKGVSDAEKQNLVNGAAFLPKALEVIKRIVNKDLRCGVGAKLVNAVSAGMIFEWPYMRCRSHNDKNLAKIKYPAIAQLKANGTHIDIVKKDGKLSFHSRLGNEYDFLGVLDKEAEKLFSTRVSCFELPLEQGVEDGVFIGECLVLDDFEVTYLPRKEGNGIITKALKGTITKEEAKRIRIHLWEYTTLESFFEADIDGVVYEEAFTIVEEACIGNEIFEPIRTWDVDTYEEVLAIYKEVKAQGLEGLVLKNKSGTFFNTGTGSPDQVKVKAVMGEEFEAEFLITGFNFGKKGTRFENGLGSLSYVSECGQIVGNVGSGFSHAERDSLDENDVLDVVATIRFDELIQNKNDPDKYALYAPRFVEFRPDKRKADALEYVKELTEGK